MEVLQLSAMVKNGQEIADVQFLIKQDVNMGIDTVSLILTFYT